MSKVDDRESQQNSRSEKLDLRGLTCPEPVLRTRRRLENAQVEQIEALVDGEVNVNNLMRLARSMKLTFESKSVGSDGSTKGSAFKVTISRQSGSPATLEDHAEQLSKAVPATRDSTSGTNVGTVIFISKDRFGDGDPEFSQNLLNIFLQTILQSGHNPRAILIANSGVKLYLPDSPAVKVLDDFKKAGTEVLFCGLCVEFYGMKEIIPVEQVTNMFAICEYLFSADKVLTP